MKAFNELVGETLVRVAGALPDSDMIEFETATGRRFAMFHNQDCCESVTVESVDGNISDIVGHKITHAEEVTNRDREALGEYDDSWTWTYYTIATPRGTVVIRWYGTSNGYYSESVDFTEVTND